MTVMSPEKKRAKIIHTDFGKRSSSVIELSDSQGKRLKATKSKDEHIQARKRENFITACEQVSHRDYFDYSKRFLLVCLPTCINTTMCNHDKYGKNRKEIPSFIQGSFETEMKNNMWYEALEVCYMSLTSTQYLSSNVLKDVVEIMLNAHEDKYSEYNVKQLIYKCQQLFIQHFSQHPPCITRHIRKCYIDFLTSAMLAKEDTFTDRNRYDCNKGIVQYCFRRLEYELSMESTDGPLVDKDMNIPEEIKHSVRGLHWQKEKCEIYEFLDRTERIERLFAVLETLIELLQYDLAIWHSRYANDLGRQLMRSHKPLMANILWTENVLYTGTVTNICRQILWIFANLIHLNYPNSMIKIATLWLNTMIQTFYACETNSNMDYPNTSKYCNAFANIFYKIIAGMPHDSLIRILEKIEPSFMRHLVGLCHLNNILDTTNSCILDILIDYIKQMSWKSYQCDGIEINLSSKLFHATKKPKRKINYLLKKLNTPCLRDINDQKLYAKMSQKVHSEVNISRRHVLHSLYITIEAYLDAFDVHSVEETWTHLNGDISNNSVMGNENNLSMPSSYSVTEGLLKKYRDILQSKKELMKVFGDLKNKGQLPGEFHIFENIGLLEL